MAVLGSCDEGANPSIGNKIPMKVLIEHEFAQINCRDYEELFFDEPFNGLMGAALNMGRELLRLDRSGERIVRHVCYEPKRDPNSPAGQAFGTSRASFIEELDYNTRTHRGEWRTIPNLFPDRVRNTGTIELVATPIGVKRIVRGEVKVSLFGFGGLVERMIVAEIEKSYAATAKLTNEWLAKQR
jgi:hypothetical protein